MSLAIVTASLNAFDNLEVMYGLIKDILCEDIEWIICDSNRSADSTSTYFYSKPFVQVISVDDSGIYDAINHGILAARGDWIIILGSDDLIFPCIKDLLPLLDINECIYSLPYTLGDLGRVYRRCPRSIFQFLRGMPLSHQCLVVNKSLYSYFLYDIDYKYASDYHWFLKVFLHIIRGG